MFPSLMRETYLILKQMEKQINLYNKQYNNRLEKRILYITVVVLSVLLWLKGCKGETNVSQNNNQVVTVPAVTNTLPTTSDIKYETIEIPKWYRDRKTEQKYLKDISEAEEKIIAFQEEIDNMQTEFMWSDSIKQAELYRLATELKRFETELEDEYLKLKISGIIGGNEIKEITPTYTIKKREIEVPKKETNFRMLAGVGLGNTLTFDKPIFNANVGFQNKKGNIINFGYDTESRILVGYNFSIFKIDK